MADSDAVEERPSKRPRLSPDASNGHQGVSLIKQNSLSAHPASFDTETKEIDVGIAAYVSKDVFPFRATLKQRYTDFLVNEILPSGQVIHLTSMSVPKKILSSTSDEGQENSEVSKVSVDAGDSSGSAPGPAASHERKDGDQAAAQPIEKPAADSPPEAGEIADKDKELLVGYLNETAASELLQLYRDILKYPFRKPKDHSAVRTEFTSDRALRGEIHGAIRRIFSSKIESSTDKDGILCLTASRSGGQTNRPKRNDNHRPAHRPSKLEWADRGGEYLHFTLYKENKDTMEAVSFLFRQMRLNAKTFQFAGTKDKRAVTAQRVSGYRVDAKQLAAQNRSLRNAAVGNFEYHPKGLELGDLGGNEFVITLRDCKFPDIPDSNCDDGLVKVQAALEKALTNLHTRGFLNYFGLQRFGTFSTRTDTTGLHILKGDFKSACDAIMYYDPSILSPENPPADLSETSHSTIQSSTPLPSMDELSRARAISLFHRTGLVNKSLDMLPRKFSAESSLIRQLGRSPSDYLSALMTIPRNLRLIYVHAYQSLVWNKAASHRWELYGDRVVEGDLVLIKEHRDKEQGAVDVSAGEATGQEEVDADGEIVVAPALDDRSHQPDDLFDRARALTALEAESGMYSIFDLVLPLPGYDVLYPANESGAFYAAFMGSEEGGGLDPNDMRRKNKDFSLSGGYRKILARIGGNDTVMSSALSVEVHRYARDEEQFVQTDLERVQQQRDEARLNDDGNGDAKMDSANDNTDDVTAAVGMVDAEEQIKDKIAAVLKFQLGSSQYATMALRELSRSGIVLFKSDYGTGK